MVGSRWYYAYRSSYYYYYYCTTTTTTIISSLHLFPKAALTSAHAGKFKFELEMASTSLASVFELMEANKAKLGVLDYSASQPTLESIFLTIAENDINRTGGAHAPATLSPATDQSMA